MKIHKRHIVLLLTILLPFQWVLAETAQSVLAKVSDNLLKSSRVECNFTVKSDESQIKGTFMASGQMFKLSTPVGTTWFDGKNMWTSNKQSKQITLFEPTSEEVAEVNPFAYIGSYKGKYKIFFSKRKENNKYLILLNPINSKENIKAVEVMVDKKTLLPERFIIRDKNDRLTTIHVNSLVLGKKFNKTDFVCPQTSMKDYELVDLR